MTTTYPTIAQYLAYILGNKKYICGSIHNTGSYMRGKPRGFFFLVNYSHYICYSLEEINSSQVRMSFKGFMLAVAVGLLLQLHPAMSLFGCGVYENPSKHKLARCAEVVETLEEVLLSSKVNLHTLRDAFLSGSYPPPSLLGVTYEISGGVQNSIEVHWSSSRVFTMIDPTLIHALQPGVLTLIYYIEGVSFLRTITLYLDLQSKKQFSENEYNYAIVAITERVS